MPKSSPAILFVLLLIPVFAIISSCQTKPATNSITVPIYPGCEKFQSDSVRKWCFKKHFTRDLEHKLNTLNFSALPDDTLHIFVRIDSSGVFHADSILPELPGNNGQRIDSLLQSFHAIPAHEGSRAVEIRFKVPVVVAGQGH